MFIIMAAPILFFVAFISAIVLLFSILDAYVYHANYTKTQIITTILILVSIVWAGFSYSNISIDNRGDFTPVAVENSQVILADNSAYNITNIFGRNFINSEKIRLVRWNSDSCGVYWNWNTIDMQVVNADGSLGPMFIVMMEKN